MMTPNDMVRPAGTLSISKIVDSGGKLVQVQDAIRFGWLQVNRQSQVAKSYEELAGPNLFVDTGRQLLAFLLGDKGPTSDFACKKFGIGTSTTPPRVTDVSLAAPVIFYMNNILKPVDDVDFPAPFVMRAEFTLAASEANGYLLTETGLFSGNGVLIARRVHVGIQKTSDFSPTLSWTLRM